MDNAIEKISRGILDTLWSQWSTLGAYLTTEKATTFVVDPEAALVGTCSIGRTDPRLFDEVLDWLTVNHELVKTARVKRFINEDTEETARTVAAVADYVSSVAGHKVMDGIVGQERDRLAHGSAGESESLFRGGAIDTMGKGNRRELDPKFLEWGFERRMIEARELSGAPDLKNPANIMLLMRSHYGRSARADILTYLMTDRPASSYQIALMIGYNQSTVYRELAAMSAGGLVMQEGRGKNTQFRVDRGRLARSIWRTEPTPVPVFFNWAGIYRAFADALATLDGLTEKKPGDVLKTEACIDLSERIVPLVRGAGEPLRNVAAPDSSRLKRPGGDAGILAFVEEALGVIQDSIRPAPTRGQGAHTVCPI